MKKELEEKNVIRWKRRKCKGRRRERKWEEEKKVKMWKRRKKSGKEEG